MGYVIAAVILLLIVAAGVTYMVLSATRRQRQASIVAPDENTPLGDTDQHAGEQTREGETVSGQDAERAGGSYEGTGASGRPAGGTSGGEGGVGGEAEGSRQVTPDSERLANRDR